MSSTNHTTNYNLPQFVGSDKPAWLGDVNPAMSAIDSAMHTNATKAQQGIDDASTAKNRADSAYTLADSAKTDAGTAQTTANTAIGNASAVALALNNFEKKFNLNNVSDASITMTQGSSAINAKLAQDSTGSIFKFYGVIQFNAFGTTGSVARTGIAGMAGKYGIATGCYLNSLPNEAYTISGAYTLNEVKQDDSIVYTISVRDIVVGTDGQIYIAVSSSSSNYTITNGRFERLYFPPCVYFNVDFGDEPTSE